MAALRNQAFGYGVGLGAFLTSVEWAYAESYRSDEARAATYQSWLHHYNHHRPHTGIKSKTPIDRLRVHNLPVKNS
ncbi:integrase core domain-containing protein [Mycolicibacterium elephantis]|uniref:integrase core domain-containing protein n=1 Tax=Mycolicibacterium elephantis TaxID=81858 RepID=UPI003A8BEEDA